MASVVKNEQEVKVVKEESYTLTLSKDEAEALVSVLGRSHYDIWLVTDAFNALRKAGVESMVYKVTADGKELSTFRLEKRLK